MKLIKAKKLEKEARSIAESARHTHQIRSPDNSVMREIVSNYNNFRKKFNEFFREESEETAISLDSVGASTYGYSGECQTVMNNAKAAEAALSEYRSSSLDENQRRRLEEVREGLDSVKDEMPIFKKDIEKSIEAMEDGNYLGGVMVAGRLIDYSFNQILAEAEISEDQSETEAVVERMSNEEGIYESSDAKVAEAVKTYRNMYNHEPGTEPDANKSIMILSGTIDFLKALKKSDLVPYK